jgi:hypothetical protein
MAKWAHSDVLDQGPQFIRGLAATTGRVKQHLIKAYAAADSYATVVGNIVASYDMVQADLVLSSSGSNRLMTVGAKSGNNASANSGASPNLHFALVDSTSSAVLFVTDETTDQVVTSGNPVTMNSWTYTVSQPT